MIHDTRVQRLNEAPVNPAATYVLYWMQASMRTRYNHALEHAIRQANELKLPALVCFGLMDDYPEANERHYAFMIEGLADVAANLTARGVRFVVRHGHPQEAALHYGADAALVVCDRGYTRHQRAWRDHVADGAKVAVVQVESDVVVPVEVASDHHEFAARTIRPKINKHLDTYLQPVRATTPARASLNLRASGDIDVTNPAQALAALKLDRSVRRVGRFTGGEVAAAKVMATFVARKLPGYAEGRNEPAAGQTSTMSPYLHFGHVSPLELALTVRGATAVPQVDRDAYLEELIVRRELSVNFCQFNPHYDTYDCLPPWARKTLSEHRNDARPVLYSAAEMEAGQTGDHYWNAAQLEMTRTGFMHNYMRMYWGKKILEWTPDPQAAFALTLYLNNKYFLCGRDPNGWANVAWVFGLHDRPWGPVRPIFGTVRYMNAAGLRRKFDMEAYVRWVETLGND
jgi:deoxyribodipyrimidine photo-lyase